MKVNSIGLETIIELERKEFIELKDSGLNGVLNFRGVGYDSETKREIPVELIYSEKQLEFLEVESEPNDVYFGEIDRVRFSINSDFYREIERIGNWGCRFRTSGKLEIRTTDKH